MRMFVSVECNVCVESENACVKNVCIKGCNGELAIWPS